MAVTIGTLTIAQLRAQPVGFNEADTTNGLVARRWAIEGLILPADWLSLLTIFDTWRAARLNDPDSLVSLEVGTTVAFSGTALGYAWTAVPCWFTSAPSAEAVGAYVGVSFELVDAQQMLTVLVRQQEVEQEVADESQPTYGTITLGGATLTLTQQPDGYADGPQLQRTAAGGLYVNGPLGVVRAKRVAGYCDATNWAALKTWYETVTQQVPVSGQLYPVQPPEMTQENILVNGVKAVRHQVSMELWEA